MEEQRNKSEASGQDGKRKSLGGLASAFLKLDTKKKIQYAAILLIVIVILTIYFSSTADTTDETVSEQSVTVETEDDSVESKLEQALSSIDGAGNVQVMITYESSAEIVPAISVDTQTSTTTDEDEGGTSTTNTENTQSEIVTVGDSDGTSALVLREDSPEVKGVIVIAEGADDIGVKLNLLNAVQTVLNVDPDRVDVYKMNNE